MFKFFKEFEQYDYLYNPIDDYKNINYNLYKDSNNTNKNIHNKHKKYLVSYESILYKYVQTYENYKTILPDMINNIIITIKGNRKRNKNTKA